MKNKKTNVSKIIISVFCAVVLALTVALMVYIVTALVSKDKEQSDDGNISSVCNVSSQKEDPVTSSEEQYVTYGEYTLNKNYSNLLLVNDKNPLPDNYDYESNLITIPQEYIKGSLNQINKDIWPYLQAMLDNARKDGVDIGVWSPYRSYDTQKMLYEKQVQRCISKGLDRAAAEIEAATVVARPGTSEHNTGLALDINCANDSFEKTEAFRWLNENAENYGFVMRYSAQKQSVTGVIHESWHWRFVGINVAKEMNEHKMCLEEYTEYIKNQG